MKQLLAAVFLTGTLALHSCKDEESKDLTPPAITIISPDTDEKVDGGESIEVRGTITDNSGLSQYKLEIHDDFDGHWHLKKAPAAFEWDTIVNLSGTSHDLKLDIAVPSDVQAGPYHFVIRATDKDGNEADFVERSIKMRNMDDTIVPMISNLAFTPSPGSNNTITLSGGNQLGVSMDVSDDQELEKYEFVVIHKSSGHKHRLETTLSGNSDHISSSYTFDGSRKGLYDFIVVLVDHKGNRVVEEVEVDFK